ncbi:MAG: hypothetical protein JRC77_00045 [Deltaproteobacteria bacterium]|nr:hypothetical protein [Deltaproteobacteria bacterium]
MLLSQGRMWRAMTRKDEAGIVLSVAKEALSDEFYELKDLKIEVPLAKWNLLVKYVHSDRKLLGGVLLDLASHKDLVAVAVGNERILSDLQRVIWDGTAVLVEEEFLSLTPRESDSI